MQPMDRPIRILLISMPWRDIHTPNPGAGLLKAVLRDAGHQAEVFDANLIFYRSIGDLYREIAQDTLAETAFAPLAYEEYSFERASAVLLRWLEAQGLDDSAPARAKRDAVRALPARLAERFEQMMLEIPWDRYDVVGFSATFNQTLASAAVARRLRAQLPHLKLIIGGAACDGPMGKAMLEAFPFYDGVAVGRAEGTVVALCERLVRGGEGNDVPGTVIRDGGVLVEARDPAPRIPLDGLPVPDFDDFFALARRLGPSPHEIGLPVEASLGCWWGQKNLCTFCGLNATSLSFSQKSPERTLAEIRELGRRHGLDRIQFTDNILPLNFYDSLVPALADLSKGGEGYELFVEIKTNASKEELIALRRAGFTHFQPGIESFSDRVLSLMKKGNTAISQVQFIKWCDELGIDTTYNVIVRNPGEIAEDYLEMARLVPSLVHLTPPGGHPSMMLERFSPYFDHPERYGIRDIAPSRLYADIFPGMPAELLSRLVYSFDYKHDSVDDPELRKARRELLLLLDRWKRVHRRDLCTYQWGEGWLRIQDLRESAWLGRGAIRWVTLNGVQAELYRFFDQAHTLDAAAEHFHGRVSARDVEAFIVALAKQRLVMYNGHRALALAIPQAHRRRFGVMSIDDAPSRPAPADLPWTEGRPLRSRRRARRLPLAEVQITEAAS
jgi:ribosomal peptide maturation radical SAM protein 1